jgi:transcriptional regulator with XRE-family HTH domain
MGGRMQIHDEINLEQLRLDAKITQADMAMRLGVSQSQVSRYEQDPDEVTLKIVRKWIEFCGYLSTTKAIEITDPFNEINTRLQLLTEYAHTEPEQPTVLRNCIPPLTGEKFIADVKAVARKPRIGVFGLISAGKSTLCNIVLGSNSLPSSPLPTTSTACYIRHVNNKPSWQIEDVWMMREGFNIDWADDENLCKNYRLCAGSSDTLKQFGTFIGSNNEHNAFVAIVYVDSPLLLACDIIDLPGYDATRSDKYPTELKPNVADIFLYLSRADCFLNQNDLSFLGTLLRQLPINQAIDKTTNPLSNLMIIATNSYAVNENVYEIINKSGSRAYNHLDKLIDERSLLTGITIREKDFLNRIFVFSAEDPNMRIVFEDALKDMLVNVLPKCTFMRLNDFFQAAKITAISQCDKWISGLKEVINKQELAQDEINSILTEDASRLGKNKKHEFQLTELINKLKHESNAAVINMFISITSTAAIETMINTRYFDKKEAQYLAGSYLHELIQSEVTKEIKSKVNVLEKEVGILIDEYNTSIESKVFVNDILDFNVRGILIGAFLATPLLPVVGILVSALYGDSWQKKLAKRIREKIIEQRVEESVLSSINKYWDDIQAAFKQATVETELNYKNNLKNLSLTFSSSPELLEIELKFAQEVRNFFGGMPWRAIKILD